MENFLRYILEQIVTQPEKIEINQTDNQGQLNINLQVADEDMGLVIGKHGQVISAIRSLAKLYNQQTQEYQSIYLQLEDQTK